MRSFWALPLRHQLLIAILLLLLPVLVAAVWSGLETLRERTDELADDAQMISRTTSAYVNRDLSTIDQMVQRLSTAPALRVLDPAGCGALFARFVGSGSSIVGLTLVKAEGVEVASVGIRATDEGPERLLDVLEKNGRRVILPVHVAPSGERYFVVGYPIAGDSGLPAAALAVAVDVRRLQDTFASLPMPPGAVVTIFETDGPILARSVDADRYVGTTYPGTPRQATAVPPFRAALLDDMDRMYAEAATDGAPWMVSVGVPTSLAIERTASTWSRSFAILGLGLVGWLVIALVLSRRLSDAVSHLDATAQRIAAGDFSPMQRKPMFSREFAELQSAFDSMLRRFNATRQMLDAQMAEERRIRQELESLQGQVIRQERLAAVGQLVSGVAHEINNPLQAILGFAELLQMQGDVPDPVKSDLKLIQKESARACGIIRNLALFARQQPGPAAPVKLNDVITSVAELRQRRLESEDIQLNVEDRSTQHVMAVLTELQQVVLNFVVNAEQAILGSSRLPGRITMRTYDKDGHVVLEVEDTGPGVKPEDEAKLFQPFFTTKPVGQGTGLGLSISYGIVDSLGGQIGYRRAPAGGSIFYFALPAAENPNAGAAGAASAAKRA
jgi:C4-dicarboxylate-specific signal transduction histidine kinase